MQIAIGKGQARIEQAIVNDKALKDAGHALAIARRRYAEYQDRQVIKHDIDDEIAELIAGCSRNGKDDVNGS